MGRLIRLFVDGELSAIPLFYVAVELLTGPAANWIFTLTKRSSYVDHERRLDLKRNIITLNQGSKNTARKEPIYVIVGGTTIFLSIY